eukprot:1263657-Pyramimonas_sp.AAC.2
MKYANIPDNTLPLHAAMAAFERSVGLAPWTAWSRQSTLTKKVNETGGINDTNEAAATPALGAPKELRRLPPEGGPAGHIWDSGGGV